MNTITLNVQPVQLTDEEFYQLCQVNEAWRLELTAKGKLLIMSPLGGKSGKREARLISKLWLWNEENNLGVVFSSSTVFRLPNGGKRSPDVALVKLERWNNLTEEDQEKFPPLCPDFVIELRSRTDKLEDLQEKMLEYLEAGLLLGWLINPQQQQVEIYRQNQDKEIIALPANLSGENMLPGFVLDIPIM
ncbi:Uma2 family endonuclease [Cyanothece sp. BG0011]|uniref:Uma2 family endonuclease n=1 Tax=Cyanothece sp. BG0011 TaxID=2082950 RepID=UPI000D1DAC87|nr:Uma2 family endonuclease [Cyanothece sp. BG0011]